ncbi:ATP-binding cassette domain-containing protein [Streptomyces sp. NPDC048639]|uniref:ATP-binding cassette domain-containing protein n=1 Tax=Streptomyces sp. NPDC048639 TaxID=3365581 RepID=UPI00371C6960
MGRPLSMLSGGERQRIKLARRLQEKDSVYVFDEPTAGLHMADVGNLLSLLDRLVDASNGLATEWPSTKGVPGRRGDRDLPPGYAMTGAVCIYTRAQEQA